MKKWLFSLLLLVSVFGYSQNQSIYTRSDRYVAFNLLDTFGTGNQYAFSLWQIRTAYTGDVLVVRRSIDNATSRFGFNGGFVDTAAIKAFVGSNSTDTGFVVRWLNQSGNRSDSAVQNTNANQPRIVTAGVLNRDGGLAAIVFDGVNDFLRISSNSNALSNVAFGFVSVLGYHSNTSASGVSFAAATTNTRLAAVLGTTSTTSTIRPLSPSGSAVGPSIAIRPTQRYLHSVEMNTSTDVHFVRLNNIRSAGAALTTGNTGATNTIDVIGCVSTDGTPTIEQLFWQGPIQEVLLWNNDQSNNLSRINQNINRRNRLY